MSTEGDQALQFQTDAEKRDEAEREHGRRSQALEAAVRTHASQGHQMTGPHFDADDVVKSARQYYDFLKGA